MPPAESPYPTFAHRSVAAWGDATLWDRAPELVDQDLRARGINSPAALDAAQAMDALNTPMPSAWAAFATLEDDAQVWWPRRPDEKIAEWRQRVGLPPDLADGINDFPGSFHETWSRSREEQENLRDFATWRTLKVEGPRGLLRAGQVEHLTQVWDTVCDPTRPLEERTRAADRWGRILLGALPDLRGQWRDPADPVTVATAVDRAVADIEELKAKPWAAARELHPKLQERFPTWPQPDLEDLAAAIWKRSSYIDIVHLCVGRPIGRKPGGVRDLVTQGRKVLELERLGAEGRRRWETWRRERGT